MTNPKERILIAIPTCHRFNYGEFESTNPDFKNHDHKSGDNNRVAALRDTWLSDVALLPEFATYKLFFGTPHNREPLNDEVFLNVPDDYPHLPHKVVAICRYALENNYDFIFKTDDDVYIWIAHLLNQFRAYERPDYSGYIFLNRGASGAGYWLSRKAFTIIANAKPNSEWAEDYFVYQTLKTNGIKPSMLPNVQISPYPDYYLNLDQIKPNVVCAHAFTPSSMREIYKNT